MKVDWKGMLFSLPLWSVTIARAANSFAYMLMNFKAPAYLQEELNFNLKDNGFINGLFYIAIMTTMFASAPASAWLIDRGYFSVTTTRKIFEFICKSIQPAFYSKTRYLIMYLINWVYSRLDWCTNHSG